MIQIIHDNRSALVHDSGTSYELDLWEVNRFIENHLKNGYTIVGVTVSQMAARWTGTSIVLDKPKKALKKSYSYWLRKKRV